MYVRQCPLSTLNLSVSPDYEMAQRKVRRATANG